MRARELAQSSTLLHLVPPILTPLAYIELRNGNREEAERLFLETLERVRRLGHREWEAGALTNLANLRFQSGDLDGSIPYAEQANQAFNELGSVKGQLVTLINLGAARLHQGDLDQAERLSREAANRARELADRRSEAFSLGVLGYIASRRGELDGADRTLAAATELAAPIGDGDLTWHLERNLAWLRTLQGRYGEAETHLGRARAIRRDGLEILAEAHLAHARGRHVEAARLIEEAKGKGDFPWAGWRDEVAKEYAEKAARPKGSAGRG